ncbi:Golgi apparatus membrane protein-like protein ECHIDNA, partial [Dorcoceras hygrometricum]
ILQAAALAFYILSALFFDSFVIIFVVTVLLSALDFWVVKNVSGCILVGLRWWNEINDDGESVWKFECLDQEVRFYRYRKTCRSFSLVSRLLDFWL